MSHGGDPSLDELLIDAARQGASGPLLEAFLHDVRNPLNALSINLEVLTEKLKVETGTVPPSQEKNLRVMREQVQRVDVLMRRFSEYLAPAPSPKGPQNLATVVEGVLEVLSSELRRLRLKVLPALEVDLTVDVDLPSLRFLVIQPLLRAVHGAEVGAELRIVAHSAGNEVVFEVEQASRTALSPAVRGDDITPALEAMARRFGGRVEQSDRRTTFRLPRAQR